MKAVVVSLLILVAWNVQAFESSDICPHSRSQAELNECAARTAKASDASLAKFYADYIKRLSPDQVQLFQASTTDWLRYRESNCRFQSSGVAGGSVYPMIFDLCIAEQSEMRLRALRELSKCQEGDLSCPAY
jgi:uncharacterized protein YecT (DUF1311 family)